MPARFYEQEVSSRLNQKRKLSAFLDLLIKKHRKGLKQIQLAYVFCDDTYLLSVNEQFLNHSTYTDIITFDLSENDKQLNAEIYISIPRVAENATKFKTTYRDELHRVIFHGALHLCGFKDKKEADKKKMGAMEDKCLKEYFKL